MCFRRKLLSLSVADVLCFFKQKTAYEMRISDWSSDVCSSDLLSSGRPRGGVGRCRHNVKGEDDEGSLVDRNRRPRNADARRAAAPHRGQGADRDRREGVRGKFSRRADHRGKIRSEEHTSELKSLMRNAYAVF